MATDENVTVSLIDFVGSFNNNLMTGFKKQMRIQRAKYNMKRIDKFEDLVLSNEEILKGIYDYGFTKIHETQKKCIMPIISSEPPANVVVNTYSGTAKTSSYAIGIFNRLFSTNRNNNSTGCPEALVLLPTREIVLDVSNVIKNMGHRLNVSVLPLVSSVKQSEMIESLNQTHHVIVGTPGRTLFTIRKGYLNVKHLKILILDEFEALVQLGFQDIVEEILKYARRSTLQICLYSDNIAQENVSNFIQKELNEAIIIK